MLIDLSLCECYAIQDPDRATNASLASLSSSLLVLLSLLSCWDSMPALKSPFCM